MTMTEDRSLIERLQARVVARLEAEVSAREASGGVTLATDDRRQLSRALITEEVRALRPERLRAGEVPLDPDAEQALDDDVFSAMWGADFLDRLMRRDDVEDICINNSRSGFLYLTDGTIETFEVPLGTGELIRLIQRQAATAGRTERRFDLAHPILDLRLPGGARLHAVMDVCEGVCVTIRLHRDAFRQATLEQLLEVGTLDPLLVALLRAWAAFGVNLIMSGDPGAGKTTLLRAEAGAIPDPDERKIVIEDDAELALGENRAVHRNVVELEARQPNIEGEGGIDMATLGWTSLRMRPGWRHFGEVRGAEAYPMVLGMTQSRRGCLATMHAASTELALDRLISYTMMAGPQITAALAARLIAGAVHFILHMALLVDGRRVVTSVREIAGVDGERVLTNEVLAPGPDGRAQPHHLLSAAARERLLAGGLDPRWLEAWGR